MNLVAEPKIDCHMHVLDPARFPYNPAVAYKPAGQEIGTPAQFDAVMAHDGVTHALIVQPNSGYGSDNSCMLDTIARGNGRFKGIAIIDFDADIAELRDLQAQGIVGAAFNPTFHGSDYYRDSKALIGRLAELGMFVQLQTEHDQLLPFVKWVEEIPVPTLIDHCGRPTVAHGLNQPAFQALLEARRHRARQREVVGLRQILAAALSVRRLPAVRARAGRCLHPRPLPVGIRLAVSARHRAAGLRPADRARGAAVSGRRRPRQVV